MSESALVFVWEDQGIAGLKYFKCGACGHVKHWKVTNTKTVRTHSGFKCPGCGKEFKLTWVGMEWEEAKND